MKKILSIILSAAAAATFTCVTAFAEPVPDIAYIPKWSEQTVYEQFRAFKVNDCEYVSTGREIKADSLGKKTGNVDMSGYDIYEDKTYCTDAETYEINNISYECAAAVKIKGNENIMVYKNYNYFPDTLGELVDGLDLVNNVSFGSMYLDNDKTEIKNYDKELLKKLLTENQNCKLTRKSGINYKSINFSTNVDMLGINNKSLSVTSDGYIITNIMEWKYVFYIGTEPAKAFADSLGVRPENFEPAVTTAVTDVYPVVIMTTAGYVPDSAESKSEQTTVKDDRTVSLAVMSPYEMLKSYIDIQGFKNCGICKEDDGSVVISCRYEEDYNNIVDYVSSFETYSYPVTVLLDEKSTGPVRGDISGDGKVTVSDAVIMQKYLTKQTDIISASADLNGDNKVNVFDYVSLRKIILTA